MHRAVVAQFGKIPLFVRDDGRSICHFERSEKSITIRCRSYYEMESPLRTASKGSGLNSAAIGEYVIFSSPARERNSQC